MPTIRRLITYTGTDEQIARQMHGSLKDGIYNWATLMSVETLTKDAPERTKTEGWWPTPTTPPEIQPGTIMNPKESK